MPQHHVDDFDERRQVEAPLFQRGTWRIYTPLLASYASLAGFLHNLRKCTDLLRRTCWTPTRNKPVPQSWTVSGPGRQTLEKQRLLISFLKSFLL